MRIRNLKDLDKRIEELSEIRDRNRANFMDSTDKSRNMASSVEQGFYFGQIALKLYRILSNYRLPPKKRIKRIILVIATIIVGSAVRNLIKKYLANQE